MTTLTEVRELLNKPDELIKILDELKKAADAMRQSDNLKPAVTAMTEFAAVLKGDDNVDQEKEKTKNAAAKFAKMADDAAGAVAGDSKADRIKALKERITPLFEYLQSERLLNFTFKIEKDGDGEPTKLTYEDKGGSKSVDTTKNADDLTALKLLAAIEWK